MIVSENSGVSVVNCFWRSSGFLTCCSGGPGSIPAVGKTCPSFSPSWLKLVVEMEQDTVNLFFRFGLPAAVKNYFDVI